VAEQVGGVYAEIRLQMDQLSKDISSAKDKFARLGKSVPAPEVRLAIGKLEDDLKTAKKRIGELNKLKVHPPEVKMEIDKLKDDISAAKNHLKELGRIEAPSPEVRLAMEKLEDDIKAAQEKKSRISKIKIHPPEVRLELEGLEKDAIAAQSKINELKTGARDAFGGLPDFIKDPLRSASGMFEDFGSGAVNTAAKSMLGIQKAIKAVPIIGLIAAAAGAVKKIFGGVMQFINSTADAWIAHQQEIAKLNNLIETTGAIAWTSGRQVQEMAQNLSASSGRAVNEIMSMQSIILSFRNITGDTFERANRAIVDMASVMGKDLASAANAVGRALDAPIEGLRALGRQGIIFTKTEQRRIEEMVNAGQIAEAQSYILRELELSFQGTAAAINDVNLAQQRLNNAEERIAIARGERTHGIRNWWTELRAARAEVRAFHQEYYNMINRASNADFSSAIAYAERMRSRLEEARGDMDELEFELAQDRVVTVELELRREKAKADMLVAMNDMELLRVAMTTGNRAFVLDLEEAFNAGGEALSDFLEAALDGMRRTDTAFYRRYRQELNALRAQQQQISAIDEALAAHGNYAAARTRHHNEQMAQMEQINELAEKLTAIEQNRIDTLEEIARAEALGLMSAEMAQQSRLAAHRREAEAINTVITMSNSLQITNARAMRENAEVMDRLNSAIQTATNRYLDLHEVIARGPGRVDPAVLHQNLMAIETHAQQQADRLRIMLDSNVLTEEEYSRQILQLRRRVANESAALFLNADATIRYAGNEGFYGRIRALNDVARETEYLAEAERERERELLRLEESQNRFARLLGDLRHEYVLLTGTLDEVRAAERARAWEAIEGSQEWKDAYAQGMHDLMRDVKEAFDAIWSHSEATEPFQKRLKHVAMYGMKVQQIIAAGLRLWTDSVRRETDALRDALREQLALHREHLRQRKNDMLFHRGFIEAQTEKQHAEALRLAIESGDQQRIFEAHSAKERFLIEEEYREAVAELEARHARKQAELDYRQAKAQWQADMTNAIVSGAMMIMRAGMNPWPQVAIPMMALAGGLGAAQLAVVASNRPRLQSFNSGGIVAGNSFSGDSVMAWVNSGEMILTRQQQQSLFDRINGNDLGGEKTVNAHIQICLDRKVIGDAIIKDINNRTYLIDAGSIR